MSQGRAYVPPVFAHCSKSQSRAVSWDRPAHKHIMSCLIRDSYQGSL